MDRENVSLAALIVGGILAVFLFDVLVWIVLPVVALLGWLVWDFLPVEDEPELPDDADEEVPAWFAAQLRETVEFCLPRVRVDDPIWCLRSTELTPPGYEDREWIDRPPGLEPKTVQAVIDKRKLALADPGRTVEAGQLHGGRLLLSAHEASNDNGLTASISGYYFDDSDVPPWDTWICVLPGDDSLLVAWVPSEFQEIVQESIANECIGMLAWADGPGSWPYGPAPAWLAAV